VAKVCSDTLECIDITIAVRFPAGLINFSKAIRLRKVVLRLGGIGDVRVAMVLKTLSSTHRDLRQISIFLPFNNSTNVSERLGEIYWQWMDLDGFLIQLWESIKFHTRVVYITAGETEEGRKRVAMLLPEMTKTGTVEFVDYYRSRSDGAR